MTYRAMVAGHICLDITPIFTNEHKKELHKILEPGKLIAMEAADIHTGGAVANTGLAMKLLGADVKLVGKIGEDAFGEIIRNILSKYDADGNMTRSNNISTSYSVVLAPPGTDRIFLHHSGANDTFIAEDILDESLEDIDLFHFGYPSIMKSMYENNGVQLVRLFKRMKEHGIVTSLDLSAVDPNSEAGKADWHAILTAVLPYVDIFVPSVEELGYMLDRQRYEEWIKRADGGDVTDVLDIEQDVRPLLDSCAKLGAKVVLVKCGAPGICYYTAPESELLPIINKFDLTMAEWANQIGFEASYKPDRVLSGTGAGDTSIAAFLTAILKGYGFKKAIEMATATGACCVSAYDALSGLLSFEELEEKILNGWVKNKYMDNLG